MASILNHWQNRLAEMTHFTIRVHKKVQLDAGNFNVNQNVNVNVNQKKKYIAPAHSRARARFRAPVHSRVRASNRSRENDAYDLDVYLGFDVIRCLERASTKCAKLVYHSRRTVRLIKDYRDARGELLLSAGGTDFCQGLTIVVNDKHGMLPLNPTLVVAPSSSQHVSDEGETYKSLDLAMYDPRKSTPPVDRKKITQSLDDANCLFFKCTKNVVACDNNYPTDYDGEEPPCCVHIMRDVGRLFVAEMSRIGLDYTVTFGTLLGLMRSNRLIPWTGDMDYLIPSKAVAKACTSMFGVRLNIAIAAYEGRKLCTARNAMVHLWDTKKTGMSHIFQWINRMCLTHDFADGKLAKFNVTMPDLKSRKQVWKGGYPYVDFYVGKYHRKFPDEFDTGFQGCRHKKSDIFPTKKALFYNNTLSQRIPANPETILRTYYGTNWKIPQPDHNPHGNEFTCSYGSTH